jgi:hypothetical protein
VKLKLRSSLIFLAGQHVSMPLVSATSLFHYHRSCTHHATCCEFSLAQLPSDYIVHHHGFLCFHPLSMQKLPFLTAMKLTHLTAFAKCRCQLRPQPRCHLQATWRTARGTSVRVMRRTLRTILLWSLSRKRPRVVLSLVNRWTMSI